VEEKVSIGTFFIAFEKRSNLSEEVKDILESDLILLSPHPKSFYFLDFIKEILDECEIYNLDPEPFKKEYKLNEIELRNSIQETYLRLKKFLEE
jgi:hypothetical protein